MLKHLNPREAAYRAVLASLHNQQYARDFLEEWRREALPSSSDLSLAQELANGTLRMALSLDFLGSALACQGRLSLKIKERAVFSAWPSINIFICRGFPYTPLPMSR